MAVSPDVYEKLGTFYLGREYDWDRQEMGEAPLLYDSKDLVTHGVVLGMTGSGKTGLCLALLEEAAMDGVPAIVIDPKGDIPNLMLTFPEFRGADFRPWIQEGEAAKRGRGLEEYAEEEAGKWREGLESWGQTGERVRQFRDRIDVRVYTPGSRAGIPVSILGSLEAPPFEVVDDPEMLGERVENAVANLLGFLGAETDPIQSGEHILLSQIFLYAWKREEDVTLPGLIRYVQDPPFASVGVVPLESFMPEKERFDLAMRLNRLLASPGFQGWTQGAALDVKRFLHDGAGKPQISIFSIAHLDDAERMFFVTLLLNEILGWMRLQTGTSSLRALLYMDEIFGYLPPVANPPSKKPLLTLLKQGRAFGLGCLLATQNPVDLDYKALSNIGSWFLGRLQTARDQARVLDGLEGAAATGSKGFDRGRMERLLAGLRSRVFLLNNVHEEEPVIFQVRWVMSYLRGPLSRGQIKRLMDPIKKAMGGEGAGDGAETEEGQPVFPEERLGEEKAVIYQLPRSVEEVYLPLRRFAEGESLVYRPALLAVAEVTFVSKKHDLHVRREFTLVACLGDRSHVDFAGATRLDRAWKGEEKEAEEGSHRLPLPEFAQEAGFYTRQKKALGDFLYARDALELYSAEALGAISHPGETEAEFRLRLHQSFREERDAQVEALRERLAKDLAAAERRLESAARAVERERGQARSAKIGTVISLGSAILSAVLGRRRVSMTSISRGATAARGVSKSVKESRDAEFAEDRLEELQEEVAGLEARVAAEVEALRRALDPSTLPLGTLRVQPYKKNIHVRRCALAWLPHVREATGMLTPVWLPETHAGKEDWREQES